MNDTIEDRRAIHDKALTALELRARRDGLETTLRTVYDTLVGLLHIVGPTTGFHHPVTLEQAANTISLRDMIWSREDCLLARNWPGVSEWEYHQDCEDDGDRRIYDHFARNKTTGEFILLDVSSNRRTLDRNEFQLHVLTGFKKRKELSPAALGPITMDDLCRHVFATADGRTGFKTPSEAA